MHRSSGAENGWRAGPGRGAPVSGSKSVRPLRRRQIRGDVATKRCTALETTEQCLAQLKQDELLIRAFISVHPGGPGTGHAALQPPGLPWWFSDESIFLLVPQRRPGSRLGRWMPRYSGERGWDRWRGSPLPSRTTYARGTCKQRRGPRRVAKFMLHVQAAPPSAHPRASRVLTYPTSGRAVMHWHHCRCWRGTCHHTTRRSCENCARRAR